MDPATVFLHRRERRALLAHRKGEPLRVLVPVMVHDRAGLLAVTPARVLHAWRGRFRTRVEAWPRRDVTGIRFDNRRYGRLLIALRGGKRRSFDFVSRQGATAVQDVLIPPRRMDPVRAALPPVALRTQRGAGARRAAGVPAPDPLAHRGTPEHQAKLRRLHARGVLSKAELEWQLRA